MHPPPLLIVVAALFAFLGLLGGIASALRKKGSSSLPYEHQPFFFSAAERSFYEILRRITPEHTVFAKVRLADVIRVSKGTSERHSHFNRICAKHVDFVLCDKDLVPVLAIELDDASHSENRRTQRDEFIDRALAAAAMPIIRVKAKRGYVLDEVKSLIAPHLMQQTSSAAS